MNSKNEPKLIINTMNVCQTRDCFIEGWNKCLNTDDTDVPKNVAVPILIDLEPDEPEHIAKRNACEASKWLKCLEELRIDEAKQPKDIYKVAKIIDKTLLDPKQNWFDLVLGKKQEPKKSKKELPQPIIMKLTKKTNLKPTPLSNMSPGRLKAVMDKRPPRQCNQISKPEQKDEPGARYRPDLKAMLRTCKMKGEVKKTWKKKQPLLNGTSVLSVLDSEAETKLILKTFKTAQLTSTLDLVSSAVNNPKETSEMVVLGGPASKLGSILKAPSAIKQPPTSGLCPSVAENPKVTHKVSTLGPETKSRSITKAAEPPSTLHSGLPVTENSKETSRMVMLGSEPKLRSILKAPKAAELLSTAAEKPNQTCKMATLQPEPTLTSTLGSGLFVEANCKQLPKSAALGSQPQRSRDPRLRSTATHSPSTLELGSPVAGNLKESNKMATLIPERKKFGPFVAGNPKETTKMFTIIGQPGTKQFGPPVAVNPKGTAKMATLIPEIKQLDPTLAEIRKDISNLAAFGLEIIQKRQSRDRKLKSKATESPSTLDSGPPVAGNPQETTKMAMLIPEKKQLGPPVAEIRKESNVTTLGSEPIQAQQSKDPRLRPKATVSPSALDVDFAETPNLLTALLRLKQMPPLQFLDKTPVKTTRPEIVYLSPYPVAVLDICTPASTNCTETPKAPQIESDIMDIPPIPTTPKIPDRNIHTKKLELSLPDLDPVLKDCNDKTRVTDPKERNTKSRDMESDWSPRRQFLKLTAHEKLNRERRRRRAGKLLSDLQDETVAEKHRKICRHKIQQTAKSRPIDLAENLPEMSSNEKPRKLCRHKRQQTAKSRPIDLTENLQETSSNEKIRKLCRHKRQQTTKSGPIDLTENLQETSSNERTRRSKKRKYSEMKTTPSNPIDLTCSQEDEPKEKNTDLDFLRLDIGGNEEMFVATKLPSQIASKSKRSKCSEPTIPYKSSNISTSQTLPKKKYTKRPSVTNYPIEAIPMPSTIVLTDKSPKCSDTNKPSPISTAKKRSNYPVGVIPFSGTSAKERVSKSTVSETSSKPLLPEISNKSSQIAIVEKQFPKPGPLSKKKNALTEKSDPTSTNGKEKICLVLQKNPDPVTTKDKGTSCAVPALTEKPDPVSKSHKRTCSIDVKPIPIAVVEPEPVQIPSNKSSTMVPMPRSPTGKLPKISMYSPTMASSTLTNLSSFQPDSKDLEIVFEMLQTKDLEIIYERLTRELGDLESADEADLEIVYDGCPKDRVILPNDPQAVHSANFTANFDLNGNYQEQFEKTIRDCLERAISNLNDNKTKDFKFFHANTSPQIELKINLNSILMDKAEKQTQTETQSAQSNWERSDVHADNRRKISNTFYNGGEYVMNQNFWSTAAHVYTDGSCYNMGKANCCAGIGVWWGDYHPFNVSEKMPDNIQWTYDQAEIHAAAKALEVAKFNRIYQVVLYTDSFFLYLAATKWIDYWRIRNWVYAPLPYNYENERFSKSLQDFKRLDRALDGIEIRWVHVKGHTGIKGNEEADKLAKNGARFGRFWNPTSNIRSAQFTSALQRIHDWMRTGKAYFY